MNWSVGNAVATADPAGNRKLDNERAVCRIDGLSRWQWRWCARAIAVLPTPSMFGLS
jgi:predicted oxidoreductase